MAAFAKSWGASNACNTQTESRSRSLLRSDGGGSAPLGLQMGALDYPTAPSCYLKFATFWDALSVIRTNMRKSPTHSGSRTLT